MTPERQAILARADETTPERVARLRSIQMKWTHHSVCRWCHLPVKTSGECIVCTLVKLKHAHVVDGVNHFHWHKSQPLASGGVTVAGRFRYVDGKRGSWQSRRKMFVHAVTGVLSGLHDALRDKNVDDNIEVLTLAVLRKIPWLNRHSGTVMTVYGPMRHWWITAPDSDLVWEMNPGVINNLAMPEKWRMNYEEEAVDRGDVPEPPYDSWWPGDGTPGEVVSFEFLQIDSMLDL